MLTDLLAAACPAINKPSFAQQVAHASIGGAIVLSVGIVALAAVIIVFFVVNS